MNQRHINYGTKLTIEMPMVVKKNGRRHMSCQSWSKMNHRHASDGTNIDWTIDGIKWTSDMPVMVNKVNQCS